MTVPLITLLLTAVDGDEHDVLSSLEAANLVRAHGDSWDIVLVTTTRSGVTRPWVHEHVVEAAPRHVLLQRGLDVARGTWVGVIGPGDRLEPGALDAIHDRLTTARDADVVYTDEQWPGEGASGIFTKPGWAPEYERGIDYLGRLCLLRRSLLTSVGGFGEDGAGVEEWDAHLRCVERTDKIQHVPVIGVVRPAAPALDDARWDAGVRAVARHLARTGQESTTSRSTYPGGVVAWRVVDEPPLVSIVVPTGGGHRTIRGQDELLVEMCARSLVENTTYDRWELVLVPSEGTPPEAVDRVREIVGDRLVVAPALGAFNFSTSINTGVAAASGSLVLLLNDDIEAIDASWLTRMVSVAQDPAIGVVGARLVDEEGRLQHVGVVYADDWLPWHILQGNPDEFTHFGVGVLDTDFVAVTGACLLMSRELYREVGGLPEDLPLNYNDVELCHKVVRAGKRVVVTPVAHLHHYESSTREPTILDAEVELVSRRWRWMAWRDPWTNTRSVT
ncbi:glycosyltransferase family 2 protein [Cellulomonas sp.]|uniref:glycosyltransferase family 2 protein n=1 Tax=Cellulomonas sp. TaxID=40001 RepID=UPI003BAA9CEE